MTVDEMISQLLQFKEEDPACGDMRVISHGETFPRRGVRGERTFSLVGEISLLERMEPGEKDPRDARQRRLNAARERKEQVISAPRE